MLLRDVVRTASAHSDVMLLAPSWNTDGWPGLNNAASPM
jgi:hypothetical protein